MVNGLSKVVGLAAFLTVLGGGSCPERTDALITPKDDLAKTCTANRTELTNVSLQWEYLKLVENNNPIYGKFIGIMVYPSYFPPSKIIKVYRIKENQNDY